jgi:hypothetical protein
MIIKAYLDDALQHMRQLIGGLDLGTLHIIDLMLECTPKPTQLGQTS